MDPQLITFISPKAGDWIILRKLQQETGAILYDPTSTDPERHPSWLIILGWPNGRAYPMLEFTEVVSDPEAAKTAVITRGPDKGNKKYTKVEEFSGIAIGTRKERVRVIKQLEVHPHIVKVITSDGVNLEVTVDITIEVLAPLSALKINFLGFAATFVIEAYRAWAANKTYKENRTVKTDNDKAIADEIYDRIEKLNTETFVPKGFCVKHISVKRVTTAQESKEVQESEERIVIANNADQADKANNDIILRANETQKKINETKMELLEKKLTLEATFITETSEAQTKQNAAWGGKDGLKTLIINGPQQAGTNQVQTIQVADATN